MGALQDSLKVLQEEKGSDMAFLEGHFFIHLLSLEHFTVPGIALRPRDEAVNKTLRNLPSPGVYILVERESNKMMKVLWWRKKFSSTVLRQKCSSMWHVYMGFPSDLVGNNLPVMGETWVWSLGWEDSLEKRMATQFQYSGLEKNEWIPTPLLHGQRSLAGYSSWDCKEWGMTDQLTL